MRPEYETDSMLVDHTVDIRFDTNEGHIGGGTRFTETKSTTYVSCKLPFKM